MLAVGILAFEASLRSRFLAQIQFNTQRRNDMQALERLGLRLKEQIPLQTLLNENFNPNLYGLTRSQRDKVEALRDIVMAYNRQSSELPKRILGSRDAAALLYGTLKDLQHEEIWVALLNGNADVTATEMIFKGGLESCVIGIREIVSKALCKNASAIILYHCHPSGNPTPSKADIKQTERLRSALDLFGIGLVDHVIISKDRYYSFADEKVSKISFNQ